MKVALNENKQPVNTYYAVKHRDEKYTCPRCHKEVMLKIGKIISPHFSHLPNTTCNNISYDMSDWHRYWQLDFPIGEKEKMIKLHYLLDEIPKDFLTLFDIEYLNKDQVILKRRCDILLNDHIIEIQHSGISAIEFEARNWFYQESGYKIIWIFDMIERARNKNILRCDSYSQFYRYYWKKPFRTFEFLDLGNENITILFQFQDSKVERLIHSSKNKETGRINMYSFMTDDYPNNIEEIIRYTEGKTVRNNPFL